MNFHSALKQFFNRNKERLNDDSVAICIGNEACDVDSFISSLVTAIHQGLIHVICMSKEVFMAKGDVATVLDYFKINPDDLIYLEKPSGALDLKERKINTNFNIYSGNNLLKSFKIKDKKINLSIVDHNEPIEELEDAEIDLIIDHHELTQKSLRAKKIYLDTAVGSCSTLVSKYIGSSFSKKSSITNKFFVEDDYNKMIARMLLVPIILDTSNFKRRTSHFDIDEFTRLLKYADIKRKEMRKLRKSIRRNRRNDKDLKDDLIMLKDYKLYHHRKFNFGCATVKYSFKDWADRFEKGNLTNGNKIKTFDDYLEDFRIKNGLDFLFVNHKQGKHRYFIMKNCPFENFLVEKFNFKKKTYKTLKYYEIPVEFSRKISMPMVINAIDKFYKTEDEFILRVDDL